MDAQLLNADWLTIEETARYCRVSHWTVREWIKAGSLTATQRVRKGRILVSAVSIEKLLEKRH
jgi:excisionase family DNA binding protein